MGRFDSALLARARAFVTGQKTVPVAEAPLIDEGTKPVARSYTELAVEVTCALCRRFEGLFLKPYLCPAGVPTIGYGATYYLDGRRVTLKDPAITKEQAEAMLYHMVKHTYLPAVLQLCPGVRNPNRLAALIDFAFNLGSTRLKTSTLRKRVNAEEWEMVPTELRKWVYGGGKKLKGLVLRSEARCKLI